MSPPSSQAAPVWRIPLGLLSQVMRQGYLPGGSNELLRQFAKRDILGRYRGSILGLAWALITPMAMLGVYTLVFLGIFKARWPVGDGGGLDFAVNVFAGLIIFNLFVEVLSRAPQLVLEQPNFVKRVVFPLPLLGWVAVLGTLFHAMLNLAVLSVAAVFTGHASSSSLAAPLALLVPLPILLAVAWFLSALGVYIRDTKQVVGLLTSLLLFLSPVLYPMSALPAAIQGIALINPLVVPIELLRALALGAPPPSPATVMGYLAVGIVAAVLAALWFKVTAKGFGDVL
jgi:lipopolysaccharide transport system permease protein